MAEELQVGAPGRLLDFLRAALPGWKRKTLEQRIHAGCVLVNGAAIRRPEHELRVGDEVRVVPEGQGAPVRAQPKGLTILYADELLVAIDKPAGLLSVPLAERRGRSALALVRESRSQPGHPARVWPVHRLDREASGVLLFALTDEARAAVQESWPDVRKLYLAVVEGHPAPPEGVVDAPLFEDRDLNVRVGDGPDAKAARTRYRTLESGRGRALLEVELDTGRRQQIRAHLAHLGHPVVGDARRGTSATRLGLHALRLALRHPRDGRELVFEAPPPRAFRALFDGGAG